MDKRNISLTVECFVKKGNKYLMLHRSPNKRIMPGMWIAPGGHREFNEGLYESARREIFEETGLSIKNLRVRATGCTHLKSINQELFFIILVADYAMGEVIQNPKDGELVWLSKNEILKLPNLMDAYRTVLPYILSNSKQIISYKTVCGHENELLEIVIEKP